MKFNTFAPRDKYGRFIKGVAYLSGSMTSAHKRKLSKAKLENPINYWLGKRRTPYRRGWFLGKNGYKYIAYSRIENDLIDLLPYKRKCIAEHILVWLRYTRTKIPKGYFIHHINRNKLDNRIENLNCVFNKEHSHYHNSINPTNKDILENNLYIHSN